MATVFREIPSKYWLILFHSENNISNTSQETETEASGAACIPTSLSNLLEILVCSHDAQYIRRQHKENDCNHGELRSFCENFPLDHHHVLLYIPNSTNIQDVLKQTVTQVLSTAQNAYAKIFTVSYSENFIKSEAAVSKKIPSALEGKKFNI